LWEQREILLGGIALPDTDTISHSWGLKNKKRCLSV
jgi:hypothetical protein